MSVKYKIGHIVPLKEMDDAVMENMCVNVSGYYHMITLIDPRGEFGFKVFNEC
jgi:hypothetical protein